MSLLACGSILMRVWDNVRICAYQGVAKCKPIFVLVGIALLVHFLSGPVIYGFVWVCWWIAINWLHYPASTDFSRVLIASGAVWFVLMVSLAYVVEWLYELLRHYMYRPYVSAMMRKYHNHEI